MAIASRNQAALDEVVAELRGLGGGGECVALRADLSTRAGCEQLAADFAASSLGGYCDVLVNNSGVSWGEPLARESGRMNWGWDRVLDLNVKAPFYLTRAMLPQLGAAAADGADAGDPARVINVGSIAGVLPQDVPTHAYDISEAAIHHLTRKLAAELATPQPGAARAVAVNAIAPGLCRRRCRRASRRGAPTRTCSRASSRSAAAAATPTWRAPCSTSRRPPPVG